MTAKMPVFYPSCLVNLRLRLDEALSALRTPVPRSVEELEDLVTTNPAFAESTGSVIGAALDPLRPSWMSGRADGELTHVVGRVPKEATFELTGYRQAWKFDLTIEYQDLPIDPRLLRAVGVEIYMDAVPAEEFSAGMVERLTPSMGFQGRLPRRRSVLTPTEENLVMCGVADDATVKHGKDGAVWSMSGRDLRGILLDSPIQDMRVMTKLDLTQPIHKVVAQIISKHPFGNEFVVDALEEDWQGQTIPSPVTKDGITRVRRKANGSGAASAPAGNERLSFWDLITHYCFLVGAIPYFRVRKLLIRPARSLFDNVKTSAGTEPSRLAPFAASLMGAGGAAFAAGAGALASTRSEGSYRRMVFGRDIRELKYSRKYQGFKPHVIKVVCLDTSSTKRGDQKLLTAQWPTKEMLKAAAKARGTSISPSGDAAGTDEMRIPVHGITSQTRLLAVAQDIYEEIGRGEIGGAVETENLASFGGDNQTPDLMLLRPGDTVEMLTDVRLLESKLPLVHEYVEQQRLDFEAAVKRIKDRVGDEKLARAVVATSRAWELQRFFRVANVKYTWSSAGLGIAFDFQNYVEARNLAPTSTGPISKKPKRAVGRVGGV